MDEEEAPQVTESGGEEAVDVGGEGEGEEGVDVGKEEPAEEEEEEAPAADEPMEEEDEPKPEEQEEEQGMCCNSIESILFGVWYCSWSQCGLGVPGPTPLCACNAETNSSVLF